MSVVPQQNLLDSRVEPSKEAENALLEAISERVAMRYCATMAALYEDLKRTIAAQLRENSDSGGGRF